MEYAEKDLEDGRYDSSSFFAQQAVEMLLKGVLLKITGARPYTHAISEMLNTLSSQYSTPVPEEIMKCAVKLERHYLSSRYPDALISEYNKWDAEEAIDCMRRIFCYVRELDKAP